MSVFTRLDTGLASLLKDPFGRLGHNWDDPERVDAACNQKLSFKSKPKPTVAVDFEKKSETAEKAEGEGDDKRYTYTDAEKTKSALKIDHETHGINSTWTFANDKLSGEVAGTLVDDDWKVKAGVGYESKKAKGEWKGAGFLDVKSPEMSGVVMALHLFAAYNQKSEVNFDP